MNESEEDESETPTENSLKWLEAEMANHVGFAVSLKTYEHDYIYGRICGVRSGGVLLVDDKKNRIFCDLGIIALYCIQNATAKSRKEAPKNKLPKKQKPEKKAPRAQKLPMQKDAVPKKKRKKKE